MTVKDLTSRKKNKLGENTATLIRYNGNFPSILFLVLDTSQASDWRTELLQKKTHPYLNKISLTRINIVVSTVERPESLRLTVIVEHVMRHVRCVSGDLEIKARPMK